MKVESVESCRKDFTSESVLEVSYFCALLPSRDRAVPEAGGGQGPEEGAEATQAGGGQAPGEPAPANAVPAPAEPAPAEPAPVLPGEPVPAGGVCVGGCVWTCRCRKLCLEE